jgi:hypothetical protein
MTNVTYGIHWVCPTTISERMLCSTEIVHLSCVKVSTISKWTETSINLRLVTYEYDQVRPK